MRAIVFASGELQLPQGFSRQLRPDDLLIAADGGLRHCQALDLSPSVAVGDFDSLTSQQVQALRSSGAEVLIHPARKDQTDLELALLLAVERGAQELLVLGALGRRWDQTLANLLLAAHPGLAGAELTLLDGDQRITAVRGRTTIRGEIGDTVSLIPLAGTASGVTTRGLEYGLRDDTLPVGATLGVSNALAAREAEISVREGVVLCIHLATSGSRSD